MDCKLQCIDAIVRFNSDASFEYVLVHGLASTRTLLFACHVIHCFFTYVETFLVCLALFVKLFRGTFLSGLFASTGVGHKSTEADELMTISIPSISIESLLYMMSYNAIVFTCVQCLSTTGRQLFI